MLASNSPSKTLAAASVLSVCCLTYLWIGCQHTSSQKGIWVFVCDCLKRESEHFVLSPWRTNGGEAIAPLVLLSLSVLSYHISLSFWDLYSTFVAYSRAQVNVRLARIWSCCCLISNLESSFGWCSCTWIWVSSRRTPILSMGWQMNHWDCTHNQSCDPRLCLGHWFYSSCLYSPPLAQWHGNSLRSQVIVEFVSELEMNDWYLSNCSCGKSSCSGMVHVWLLNRPRIGSSTMFALGGTFLESYVLTLSKMNFSMPDLDFINPVHSAMLMWAIKRLFIFPFLIIQFKMFLFLNTKYIF